MCISIPPKHAVSNVAGYLKGNGTIQIARGFGDRQKNLTGEHFRGRGISHRQQRPTSMSFEPTSGSRQQTRNDSIHWSAIGGEG